MRLRKKRNETEASPVGADSDSPASPGVDVYARNFRDPNQTPTTPISGLSQLSHAWLAGTCGRLHHRHVIGARSLPPSPSASGPSQPRARVTTAIRIVAALASCATPAQTRPPMYAAYEPEHDRTECPADGYLPRTRLEGARGPQRQPQKREECEEHGGHGNVAGDGGEDVPEHHVPP